MAEKVRHQCRSMCRCAERRRGSCVRRTAMNITYHGWCGRSLVRCPSWPAFLRAAFRRVGSLCKAAAARRGRFTVHSYKRSIDPIAGVAPSVALKMGYMLASTFRLSDPLRLFTSESPSLSRDRDLLELRTDLWQISAMVVILQLLRSRSSVRGQCAPISKASGD